MARGFVYRGKRVSTSTGVATYVRLLRYIWADFPEKRDYIMAAVNRSVSFRFGIAATPSKLYPGNSSSWRTNKYCEFEDGLYLDTNLSNATKRARLIAVVRSVGLLWDDDVKVYGL
jgi:hypothetical protein